MITVIPLPESIYNQYINDGVDFNNLTDIEYLVDVSSVNDIVEISESIEQFPKGMLEDDFFKLLKSPVGEIKLKALESESVTLVELDKTLTERIATKLATVSDNNIREYAQYSLKQIGEYLWVAVQKSLPSVSIDPVKESIIANKPFINDMVSKLLDVFKFEDMSKTNLFRLYLDSNLSRD